MHTNEYLRLQIIYIITDSLLYGIDYKYLLIPLTQL